MYCHLETTDNYTYNFIEVFLVKDKSKRDICMMLKKTSCVTAYDSVQGNTHKKYVIQTDSSSLLKIKITPTSYKNILEFSIDVFSPVCIK